MFGALALSYCSTALFLSMPAPQSPPAQPQNHLAGETSPYLLQHVNNPVDWYPWGDEALNLAKKLDRPIFLSIGYSACHWCHVMEHESFENEEIADYLNENFISIKVDREERPDLDDFYMGAVQRMTGSGGWPMTVFMTPKLQPFYGGTYFPPTSRYGRPGFLELLQGIEQAWRERRTEIEESAASITEAIQVELPAKDPQRALPDMERVQALRRHALDAYWADFDHTWGGFGAAPKFPRTDDLRWMVGALPSWDGKREEQTREMLQRTLISMAAAGMYDQIGGGFARYSVDEKWWIPHFEKMLYDQGTLLTTYAEAWQRLPEPRFERIMRQSCDYLLRERQDPRGGFWSATDADSEGEEGKFFAWTPQQLQQVLDEERAAFAMQRYGVTAEGTFEHGSSVLRDLPIPEGTPAQWPAEVEAALYQAREARVPPGNDDKILTGWNGLAIEALAHCGRTLGEERYLVAAQQAADFLFAELRSKDGEWRRAWRSGKAQHSAVLEDHAYLCRGLLALFQATGDERWLLEAQSLAEIMLRDFDDARTDVFFDTDGRDPHLLHRKQSPWDGATPSPNSIALESMFLLYAFTHDSRWLDRAQRGMLALLPHIERNPRAFASALRLLPWCASEPAVALVVGTGDFDSLDSWRSHLRLPQLPECIVVMRASAAPDSELALFANRAAIDGLATLYFCEGATCQAPTSVPPDSWR